MPIPDPSNNNPLNPKVSEPIAAPVCGNTNDGSVGDIFTLEPGRCSISVSMVEEDGAVVDSFGLVGGVVGSFGSVVGAVGLVGGSDGLVGGSDGLVGGSDGLVVGSVDWHDSKLAIASFNNDVASRIKAISPLSSTFTASAKANFNISKSSSAQPAKSSPLASAISALSASIAAIRSGFGVVGGWVVGG